MFYFIYIEKSSRKHIYLTYDDDTGLHTMIKKILVKILILIKN